MEIKSFLKLPKLGIFILKFGLGILSFYLIYQMVKHRAMMNSLSIDGFLKIPNMGKVLGLVLFLTACNWFLEALKWKFLVRKVESLSLSKSIQSLLSGLYLAIFTPARIGEYGGRILYLKPENRKQGAICVLVGNLSQFMVTTMLGLLGTYFWVKEFMGIKAWALNLMAILFIALVGLILFGFFRISKIEPWIEGIKIFQKMKSTFLILKEFSAKDLGISLLFSLGRYLIFSNQYIILLFGLLGVHSYRNCFFAMGLIFMVQSYIPSFVLADIGIRGATSSYFLGFIFGKQNIIPILASSFLVWFLNIILPALIGIYFILKIKNPFGRI